MFGDNQSLFELLSSMGGDTATPQKSLKERWADYIDQQQNGGGGAPASVEQRNPLSYLNGQIVSRTVQGMPGEDQGRLPSPVDYKRMQSILNSGVLRPQAPTAVAPAPVQAPQATAPSHQNPIDFLLGNLFGRLRGR